jgi:hypothetical protein
MTFPVRGSPACFFAADTLGPVSYDGRELWLSYRFPVETGDRVHLLFERFSSRPRQGLQVLMVNKRHQLAVSGHQSRQFILWADTAPRHVEIEIAKAGRGGTLVLVNAWEDEKYGTMFYGLNWTAMDVRTDPDGSLLLDCSDGYGLEPSFGDLVVRVVHERA